MTSVAQTSERNWDWEQTLQLECIGLLSLQDYSWQWFFYSTVVKQEVAIAIDIVHVSIVQTTCFSYVAITRDIT